jgi:hypothetical protein
MPDLVVGWVEVFTSLTAKNNQSFLLSRARAENGLGAFFIGGFNVGNREAIYRPGLISWIPLALPE